MSTPVKPPGPGATPGPTEQTPEIGNAEKPSAPFQEVLDSSQKIAQQAGIDPAAIDPVQAIAQQLSSGAIDVDTAIDALLQRALANPSVGGLSAQQREQLESLLRDALQTDPTLAALIKDLESSK